MQEYVQEDVSACDRQDKMDVELQGKEHVLEMKMHTEFKKWKIWMRGKK